MRSLVSTFALSAMTFAMTWVRPASADEPDTYCLDHKVTTIDGEEVDLKKYEGKVLLIVNVASRCGLTPQYKQLQAIYEKFEPRGLAVLGFPCNQFLGQEPGTAAEIKQFCQTKYHVAFDLFSKIDVNGKSASDLYQQLTSLTVEPVGKGPISWNFEKFLVDRQGRVVARFGPRTSPDDPKLVSRIEQELNRES